MRRVVGDGFVLVGGKSRRMGVSKASLAFEDSTLLHRSIDVLQRCDLQVRLVAAAEDRFNDVSVPVLVDRVPEAGPLGGICTALFESESGHCFFLPCDTPLVEPTLFELMMEHSQGRDAVVPVDSKGQLHPLSAYYSVKCRDFADELLGSGQRRVGALLESEGIRVLRLPVSEYGIPDWHFHNVNTPEEYKELIKRRVGLADS